MTKAKAIEAAFGVIVGASFGAWMGDAYAGVFAAALALVAFEVAFLR